MENEKIVFSIIVPIFNEENVIKEVLLDLDNFLRINLNYRYELIAVNDGSTDKTDKILTRLELNNFSCFSNPYNKGYGAAIKLGVQKAQGAFVLFYDGDGQHNPREILKLVNNRTKYDMVIGSRQEYKGPKWRQPGKKIINIIANYLVNYKIPDLNSGFRIVRRECFNKFLHLYPNGFSLSTTITLAFIKHGFNVKYISIKVNKREGKSEVKLSDGFKAVNLVLRMIMLFSPMKIFLPCSLFFSLLTLASLYIDIFIYKFNISESTLIFFISSIILFFIGLIADQLASLRREMKL